MAPAPANRRANGLAVTAVGVAMGGTLLVQGVAQPAGAAFTALTRTVSAALGSSAQSDFVVGDRELGGRAQRLGPQAFAGSAQEAASAAPHRWWSACTGLVGSAAVAATRLRPRLRRRNKQQQQTQQQIVALNAAESDAPAADTEAPPAMPKVLVVNLDKSVERWEQCKDEFAAEGVTAERFPATLGKAMSREERLEKTTWSARYFCTDGMIGCFMSHIRIWQKVVDEDLPYVIILEDDVVLMPDFEKNTKVLLQELPKDWDVCLLGAVGCIDEVKEPLHMKLFALITGGGRPKEGETRTLSDHVFIPYKPAGTHAYMVSRKGAEVLLRNCPKPRYHVDITAWALKDLRLYMSKPIVATQRFDEEDTTVSKGGAPLTKRFLRWCWDITGLSAMGRAGGLPNLTWAWKIAVFALPVPFSSKRIIVEMGPSSSMFVLLMLLSIPLRSPKLAGFALLYMNSIVIMVRWLAGTLNIVPIGILGLMSAACFCLA